MATECGLNVDEAKVAIDSASGKDEVMKQITATRKTFRVTGVISSS